jgi:quercetin dioxygenase-like cupin family protein
MSIASATVREDEMVARRNVITAIAVLGFALLPGSAGSQHAGDHKLIPTQDIKWGPAPPSVPPGAQAAVLYGDPGKDGMFAFRLKMPKDYHIPPHTHPKPEIVTVLSGTARLGMGDKADRAKAQVLPAGSFFALSPGSAHYFFADEDTVIQLNSTGPWGITYLNDKDDPRKK